MLRGTYDAYHGLLRPGDEKNVPQDTAERWEKNKIAEILPDVLITTAKDKAARGEKKTQKKANTAKETSVSVEQELVDEVIDDVSEAEETDVESSLDLSTLTRDQLTEIAKSRGILVNKAMKTETLIRKLEE